MSKITDALKSLVSTVAPTIASAIGGPLAGQAVQALSNAVFGHPNGSEGEVADALAKATPEQLLAIKQADNTFREHMKALDVDLKKLKYADVADARKLAQNDSKTQRQLSGLILLGYALVAVLVLTGFANATLRDPVVAAIAGGIINEVLHMIRYVVRFWFGGDSSDEGVDK